MAFYGLKFQFGDLIGMISLDPFIWPSCLDGLLYMSQNVAFYKI